MVQQDPKVFRRRWLWPILLAALIFAASSRSEVAAPSVPGTDKAAHFVAYGMLATLVLRAFRGADQRLATSAPWAALLLASLHGISDEWHQSFTPGRAVEVADWVADTLGAALAVTFYSRWKRYRETLELPVRLRRKPRVESAPVAPSISAS